jgi:hypothetical protein
MRSFASPKATANWPSAIQIAEYWEWDRALPVTPARAGLGFSG